MWPDLEEYQDAYSVVRKCHKQHSEALVRLKPYLSNAKQKQLLVKRHLQQQKLIVAIVSIANSKKA